MTMHCNLDSLANGIAAIAEKAVIDEGIDALVLTKRIRDTILKRAKEFPTFPVVLNTCYGGFGLNDKFVEYRDKYLGTETESGSSTALDTIRTSTRASYRSRIYLVPIIEAFGRDNTTPELVKTVEDLRNGVDDDNEFHLSEEALENTDLAVGLILAGDEFCKLDIENVYQFLNWNIVEYDGQESVKYT